MWEILGRICEWFLGLGMLAIMFGLPAFLLTRLFVIPLYKTYQDVKNGAPFFKSLKKNFPTNGSSPDGPQMYRPYVSRDISTPSTAYVNNPLYSSMPGNIFNRR